MDDNKKNLALQLIEPYTVLFADYCKIKIKMNNLK